MSATVDVPVSVRVRIFHPHETLVETYELDDPGSLAAWGWNARHFVTAVCGVEYRRMTEDEAKLAARRRKQAMIIKRKIIAEMNAGRL